MLGNPKFAMISMMVQIPSQAVAASAVSVCSASYGTNDLQKLNAGYNYALWISVISSVVESV